MKHYTWEEFEQFAYTNELLTIAKTNLFIHVAFINEQINEQNVSPEITAEVTGNLASQGIHESIRESMAELSAYLIFKDAFLTSDHLVDVCIRINTSFQVIEDKKLKDRLCEYLGDLADFQKSKEVSAETSTEESTNAKS